MQKRKVLPVFSENTKKKNIKKVNRILLYKVNNLIIVAFIVDYFKTKKKVEAFLL